mmetsp:Transcript_24577/g.62427  ORF Transcript_24577/g.62427 Transcript_24577/m.62427 type:complete len:382 (-) Transcript_24577:50-1195(-)
MVPQHGLPRAPHPELMGVVPTHTPSLHTRPVLLHLPPAQQPEPSTPQPGLGVSVELVLVVPFLGHPSSVPMVWLPAVLLVPEPGQQVPALQVRRGPHLAAPASSLQQAWLAAPQALHTPAWQLLAVLLHLLAAPAASLQQDRPVPPQAGVSLLVVLVVLVEAAHSLFLQVKPATQRVRAPASSAQHAWPEPPQLRQVPALHVSTLLHLGWPVSSLQQAWPAAPHTLHVPDTHWRVGRLHLSPPASSLQQAAPWVPQVGLAVVLVVPLVPATHTLLLHVKPALHLAAPASSVQHAWLAPPHAVHVPEAHSRVGALHFWPPASSLQQGLLAAPHALHVPEMQAVPAAVHLAAPASSLQQAAPSAPQVGVVVVVSVTQTLLLHT